MGYGRRLATLSTVGILGAGALALSAGAAAAAETGTLRFDGWFDPNKNGVRDAGEQAIPNFEQVYISNKETNQYYELQPGQNAIDLPAGEYFVSLDGYLETRESPNDVRVTAGGEVVQTYSLVGRTFHGVAWQDANADGVRQQSEARQEGVRVRSTQDSAVTDAEGRYTLHNVSLAEGVSVEKTLFGKPLVLAPSQQGGNEFYYDDPDSEVDSDFSAGRFVTPGMAPIDEDPEQVVPHADLGVVSGSYGQSLRLDTDQDLGAIPVGATFDVRLTVRGDAGIPVGRAIEAVSDGSGVEFAGFDGRGWRHEVGSANNVMRFYPDRPLPAGAEHTVVVTFRAVGQAAEPIVTFRLNDGDANGPDVIEKFLGFVG